MAMSSTHRKFLIAGTVLLGAVGYLCYAGISAGQSYCLSVDTFLGGPQFHNQKLLLFGEVSDEDLSMDFENMDVAFLLLGEQSKIKVQYHGVIPDMFKAGGQVVVRGKLSENKVFKADQLLTKCASKYEKRLEDSGKPQ